MNLEKNNIDAQVKLMDDIISNYKGIIYHITENGKELHEFLQTSKINEPEKTVTISKEVFDKILDISYILKDESKFSKLGILAQNGTYDNKIKLELLQILKSGTKR